VARRCDAGVALGKDVFALRQVIHHGRRRIALVAPTAADARDVMVEGESGLLAIGPPQQRPQYEPTKRRRLCANLLAECGLGIS
jgi:phage terminase large subunit-like protein